MSHDPMLPVDAVDSVLRSEDTAEAKLHEIRALVEATRGVAEAPPAGVIPLPYSDDRPYDPRD